MKTIVVACGGGIATSQTVAVKLGYMLEEKGFHPGSVQIDAININSLPDYITHSDLYVSICPVGEAEYNIPTFSGIPFLTGISAEEELEKIIAVLNR